MLTLWGDCDVTSGFGSSGDHFGYDQIGGGGGGAIRFNTQPKVGREKKIESYVMEKFGIC